MPIQLTIDGKPVSIEDGASLMLAAQQAGVDTPVICYHEATTPNGLCRQCVVEVEGWRVLAPACITSAAEGMVVHTASERVTRARRTILEMLNASMDLSEAPAIQQQMDEYKADRKRFPGAHRRSQPLLDDNPFYVRDYDKCLMCWRCVQACGDDLQFTYALSTGGRGYESHIATFFDAPMTETTCVFCGNCVAVCPTNALVSKTEIFMSRGLDYDAIRREKRKQRRAEKKEFSDD
ncbi:MAG: 2Fe-2S iron-sulfur cluster binding domain-containing protein [Anaerolineae bacterium]|nr:MAG: 2Fe-2S iron-sulfur cluster binding domain-containing protein [Anaerolineae bacterium]